MARARQHRHKRSRDVDAELLEEFVKVTTAGERDDEDAGENPEHDELPPEKTLRPDEVFQKISFRPDMEEQKKLLLFQFQARQNQYVKDFLAESWMKEDLFADANTLLNSRRHLLHDVFAEFQSWNAAASVETKSIFSICLYRL